MQCAACGLYYSKYLILLPIRIISPSKVETLKMRAGSLVYSEIKSAEENWGYWQGWKSCLFNHGDAEGWPWDKLSVWVARHGISWRPLV